MQVQNDESRSISYLEHYSMLTPIYSLRPLVQVDQKALSKGCNRNSIAKRQAPKLQFEPRRAIHRWNSGTHEFRRNKPSALELDANGSGAKP